MLSDERIREIIIMAWPTAGHDLQLSRMVAGAMQAIRTAVAEAVAAEREACARRIERKGGIRCSIYPVRQLKEYRAVRIWELGVKDTKQQLAAAIRARGESDD